jgi:hypothetical protein
MEMDESEAKVLTEITNTIGAHVTQELMEVGAHMIHEKNFHPKVARGVIRSAASMSLAFLMAGTILQAKGLEDDPVEKEKILLEASNRIEEVVRTFIAEHGIPVMSIDID